MAVVSDKLNLRSDTSRCSTILTEMPQATRMKTRTAAKAACSVGWKAEFDNAMVGSISYSQDNTEVGKEEEKT